MRSLIRTLIPLAISTTFAAYLAFFLSDQQIVVGLQKDIAPWDSFFNVFGMLYAIISGFLLLDVLDRHSDLNNAFESELNAVEDLRDFLVYVDGDQDEAIALIKERLHTYVRSVSAQEWPAMVKGKPLNSDTTPELYGVMRAIDQIEVTNESDRVALLSLIEKVSDITSLRTQRISLANQHLAPRLKFLSGFMSFILVGALILQGSKDIVIHMTMVGAITIAVHLLYLIIIDLDQPFVGHWNIQKEPLNLLVQNFSTREKIK